MLHGFDENFAQQYTALAVTHNFIGSPHIDRQNVCPFYGISLGNFDDGTGGIMVECRYVRVLSKLFFVCLFVCGYTQCVSRLRMIPYYVVYVLVYSLFSSSFKKCSDCL